MCNLEVISPLSVNIRNQDLASEIFKQMSAVHPVPVAGNSPKPCKQERFHQIPFLCHTVFSKDLEPCVKVMYRMLEPFW